MLPLSGLRVVELAGILAAPSVGMFLAELGAEVVKVENPRGGGDRTRGYTLPGEDPREGRCAYFCSVNWGKRSVALDLKQEAERQTLSQLVARADILLVNFRPGSAARLGLDLEALQTTNPGLIMAAVTGYGQQSERPGFDALVQAESGFMAMNGPVGGPACKMPVALIDLMAGHQLKQAILLALLRRQQTGRGGQVEVSLWQTALAALSYQATNYLMAGFDMPPSGTEHPNLFPYGTLVSCADGEVLLAVATDGQFEHLCDALQAPELKAPYRTNAQRVEARECLRAELGQRAKGLRCQALLLELERLAVPAGQLRTVSQTLALAQVAAQVWRSDDGLAGFPSVAFEGLPRTALRPPPRLGEHTEEVLREWLA